MTPVVVHRITRDVRGVPYIDDPIDGRRVATDDEVAAAGRAAVAAMLAAPSKPRPHATRTAPAAPPVSRRPSRPILPWDAPPSSTVFAGRYAVDIDGVLAFFRVLDDGRIKVQRSDDLHSIGTAAQEHAARVILADPDEAMRRYGREIGVCGACGRTLTNQASRDEGIGPVCGHRTTETPRSNAR